MDIKSYISSKRYENILIHDVIPSPPAFRGTGFKDLNLVQYFHTHWTFWIEV